MNPSTIATADALSAQGLALHQAGRVAEATRLYEEALALDPHCFQALDLLGVACIQTGRMEEAVELIRRAIAVNPDVAGTHGNLANALNRLRRHEAAIAAADAAIALQPAFAEAHGNRGEALHALGRREEALASYGEVVRLKPSAQAHFNEAAMLRELGRHAEAVASYDRAIAMKPDYAEAHRGRGVAQGELNRPDEALKSFDRAVAVAPNYADAHLSRGVALRELGRAADAVASFGLAIALGPGLADAYARRGNALCDLKRHEEALADYDQAIALNPAHAEALSNRMVPLRELRRRDEALATCDQAIALQPDYAEAHNNRGGALYDQRRLEESLASYDKAIALKPGYAAAYGNKGAVLYEMRRLPEALATYDLAIAAKPDDAEAQHNQALCRLALGDFARGWPQYEWRWRTAQFAKAARGLAAPLWLGEEDLAGRTILLRAEQGLGDTLQFCRYAPAVAERGARVVLEVQPGLERLLARVDGVAEVVTFGRALPAYDAQTPLMSLPLALGLRLDQLRTPYLSAEPAAAAARASSLAPAGLRVGLCWAGGARANQAASDSVDERRSLALQSFAPFADIDGVAFYSLQKGPGAAQLEAVKSEGWSGPKIIDLSAELDDFADTAALVANLDLVISCDTAIAHLAGGMGKAVWILNRFDSCWRWLEGREASPWYPSARLFTQTSPADWETVIGRVRDELASLASRGA